MKALLSLLTVVSFSVPLFWAGAAESSPTKNEDFLKTQVLGVLSRSPKADFEAKLPDFFKEQFGSCTKCEVRNLTPYDQAGNVDWKQVPKILEANSSQVPVLFLSWNDVFNEKNKELVDALKAWTAKGLFLVGPAGEPMGEGPSHALSRTILGQVPDAVIIGELNERESFPQRSFYGPEMLTAIKPPMELRGENFAACLFAARLVREWNKRPNSEWVSHFRARKSLSKRIWPGLDELFSK